MKLVWKGKFTSNEELERNTTLPEHAVQFDEPDNLGKFLRQALVFVVPIVMLVAFLYYLKSLVYGAHTLGRGSYLGLLLAVVAMIPHELMHASLFPRDAVVEVWYSSKHMAAFVYCTAPVTRARFIVLSLTPNLILGLVPMILWVLIPPQYAKLGNNLFLFAVLNLLSGMGDYLNSYNAWKQVPRNGIVQNSGIHSYWYVEGEQR